MPSDKPKFTLRMSLEQKAALERLVAKYGFKSLNQYLIQLAEQELAKERELEVDQERGQKLAAVLDRIVVDIGRRSAESAAQGLDHLQELSYETGWPTANMRAQESDSESDELDHKKEIDREIASRSLIGKAARRFRAEARKNREAQRRLKLKAERRLGGPINPDTNDARGRLQLEKEAYNILDCFHRDFRRDLGSNTLPRAAALLALLEQYLELEEPLSTNRHSYIYDASGDDDDEDDVGEGSDDE